MSESFDCGCAELRVSDSVVVVVIVVSEDACTKRGRVELRGVCAAKSISTPRHTHTGN